ncbi:hypothetical protein EOI86_14400 [Hwanghaeella grinnelliae]|uniref:Uncharacterized protein n=1 Tax=Hwanghaeella grinnelliae TaxID=2500179 RepID=A0A437QPD1_9PROT|nr:hypothetical protein [Hwanghaeella grinnelliae]RVU36393.1 hypothetical protein EOI86_14400 [Hwanghaeella grinnelliae]
MNVKSECFFHRVAVATFALEAISFSVFLGFFLSGATPDLTLPIGCAMIPSFAVETVQRAC